MSEVADFANLIRDGMSVEERLEQLQYETEDDGTFAKDPEGNFIPRGQLSVRKYASDPEGPLALVGSTEVDTIAFLDFDKVLDRVIKAEKKLYGLGGRMPGKNKKAAVKMAAQQKAAEPAKEKKKMAPKIMLRRPGARTTPSSDKTPSKVQEKVSTPATSKKKVTKKTAGKRKPAAAVTEEVQEQQDAASASVDMGAIQEMVQTEIAAAMKPLDEKLDAILATLGSGPGYRSIADTVVGAATAVHDALQQKISNLYFGLAVDEDGNVPEDVSFPFLEEGDGRDLTQNLLENDPPLDVVSFYLDGVVGED